MVLCQPHGSANCLKLWCLGPQTETASSMQQKISHDHNLSFMCSPQHFKCHSSLMELIWAGVTHPAVQGSMRSQKPHHSCMRWQGGKVGCPQREIHAATQRGSWQPRNFLWQVTDCRIWTLADSGWKWNEGLWLQVGLFYLFFFFKPNEICNILKE